MTPEIPTWQAPSPRLRKFAVNAFWSMLSVAVSLGAGILISPYLVSKLGPAGYGVWSLVFSVSTYVVIMDFGFRSAVVNFTARHIATKSYDRINEVLSTALAYSAIISAAMFVAVLAVAPRSPDLLGISDSFRGEFPLLFVIVSGTFVVSMSFNILSGCLEGFQLYGPVRRMQTVVLGARTLGYFIVLWMGGGLQGLVLCMTGGTVVLWIGYVLLLRRHFPELRLGWRLAHRSTLRSMVGYGLHTNTNSLALMLLEQTPPVLISRALAEAAVGYFALPLRIAQIPLGFIRSVSDMLNPIAADLRAREDYEPLARVGILGNRYSFVLYAPIALLILTWGVDILRLWIDEEFAVNAGPLLFYFVLGNWLGVSGQASSIGILFGIQGHSWVGWGLLGEALAVCAACLMLPDWGLTEIAIAACIAMIANRGLVSAWAMCRHLKYSFGAFLWSIYGVPLLLAIPVYAILQEMHERFPTPTWTAVFLAAAFATLAYLVPAFFLCIEKPHRRATMHWAGKLIPKRS